MSRNHLFCFSPLWLLKEEIRKSLIYKKKQKSQKEKELCLSLSYLQEETKQKPYYLIERNCCVKENLRNLKIASIWTNFRVFQILLDLRFNRFATFKVNEFNISYVEYNYWFRKVNVYTIDWECLFERSADHK